MHESGLSSRWLALSAQAPSGVSSPALRATRLHLLLLTRLHLLLLTGLHLLLLTGHLHLLPATRCPPQAFDEMQFTKSAKVKSARDSSRKAREQLAASRHEAASSLREQKAGLAEARQQQLHDYSVGLKETVRAQASLLSFSPRTHLACPPLAASPCPLAVYLSHSARMQTSRASQVNSSVSERFVTPENSRRMLQHPHYSEVSAVAADVTSAVSREIAASPKRSRRPQSATGAAPAIGGPATPARK